MNVNKRGSKIKYCRVCKVRLTTKNVCKCLLRRKEDYICNECHREIGKIYVRKHEIGIDLPNGKKSYLHGNKRPYPTDQKCELCREWKKILVYHHWDDKDISKGIWCCSWKCHGLAEALDKRIGLEKVYYKLKKKISFAEVTI